MMKTVSTSSAGEGVLYPLFHLDREISDHWIDIEVICADPQVFAVSKSNYDGRQDCLIIDIIDHKPGRFRLLSAGGILISLNSSADLCFIPYTVSDTQLILPYWFSPSIACPMWPDTAKEWQTRLRHKGWPPCNIVKSIAEKGCHCVPCLGDNSQFKFSFALAECSLFQDAVSSSQKYCYIVLCFLCFHAFKCEHAVSVRVLKHVFFYACENIPPDFFQTSPRSCILYMLGELQAGFQRGSLPHYFIPSQNMINHLSSEQLKDIRKQVTLLRSEPHLTLQKIHRFHKLCTKGDLIIEMIYKDFEEFQLDKSIRESTVQTSVPCLMEIFRDKVNTFQYEAGLEVLNQAFQYHLAVATCEDTVLYQAFLEESLRNLTEVERVWFSMYVEGHLEGQLPKPIFKTKYDNTT